MNQGPYWDAGDILGGGDAPGRTETLAPWNPRPWKASPCHEILKEQAGLHPTPLPPTCRPARHHLLPADTLAASSKCALETFSRPNRWAPSITWYPSGTPGINQHNPSRQTDNLCKQTNKQTKLNNQQNWEESKMATGTQLQTAWALWIRDLAETLEPHLQEVKH
jgi:hypothetical protein